MIQPGLDSDLVRRLRRHAATCPDLNCTAPYEAAARIEDLRASLFRAGKRLVELEEALRKIGHCVQHRPYPILKFNIADILVHALEGKP
jgi:hypothetical protein